MKWNPYIILLILIKLTQKDQRLKLKAKTTQLSGGKTGENHHELEFDKGSLDLTPNAKATKEKEII